MVMVTILMLISMVNFLDGDGGNDHDGDVPTDDADEMTTKRGRKS